MHIHMRILKYDQTDRYKYIHITTTKKSVTTKYNDKLARRRKDLATGDIVIYYHPIWGIVPVKIESIEYDQKEDIANICGIYLENNMTLTRGEKDNLQPSCIVTLNNSGPDIYKVYSSKRR